MIKYQQEFMCNAEEEIAPLAQLEWDESGHPDEGLCINWDAYFDLEDRGIVKFFTARDDDRLIGYCVVILSEPLTTKGSIVALYDSVYVDKAYRSKGLGRDLFSFVEKCMVDDGVYRVLASSSAKNPIGRFLQMMGYAEMETKYEKRLS